MGRKTRNEFGYTEPWLYTYTEWENNRRLQGPDTSFSNNFSAVHRDSIIYLQSTMATA